MSSKPEHIVVLMLENRSFDHMMGWMRYPAFSHERLTGSESNRTRDGRVVRVDDKATTTIRFDPGHYHENVMRQLLGWCPDTHPDCHEPPYKPTNGGFVDDYQRVVVKRGGDPTYGDRIMSCFEPAAVPVLSKLAEEFAVCTRWFCSVPGATWPNRNFAHAATSSGEVGNPDPEWSGLGKFADRTIFEHLESADHSWAIYLHTVGSQVFAFKHVLKTLLLNEREARRRYFRLMERFEQDVANDALPSYSFIEPYHQKNRCNSQHPWFVGDNEQSFRRGEQLIADVYNALRNKPEVFAKTLLVITYDEHGGFFDRMAPESTVAPDDQRGAIDFGFDLLGPRVPAVLVSPRIKRNTVVDRVFDHASIVRTVRDVFGLTSPLTRRDEHAAGFSDLLGSEVRRDLPTVAPRASEPIVASATPATDSFTELDSFEESMVHIALSIGRELEAKRDGGKQTGHEVPPIEAHVCDQFSCDHDLAKRLDEIDELADL